MPDDTIKIKMNGHGGQSLGFTLAKGVSIEVEGDANDGIGKCISGGKISVYPSRDVRDKTGFVAADHVIVGNACLYGASRGKCFFSGKAGERFAVRNSGALSVVEGVGDHGCEYMTGGRIVVLGETGRNFAAGMSGGIAYVHDPNRAFPDRVNLGMVQLEQVDSAEEAELLRSYIQEHAEHTDSSVGQDLLERWDDKTVSEFVKVMPIDYKAVLDQLLELGATHEQAAQGLTIAQFHEQQNAAA